MFHRIGGNLMNVVSFGSPAGDTLVAHGGWTGSWELWQQPFELMSDRWRCISYDHRGTGETLVDPASITADAMVDVLFEVLDALSVERCVLAGESMGALIALLAVNRAPERFSGLVLVGGAPFVTPDAVADLVSGARTDYVETTRAFIERCLPEPDSEHVKRWGRHILARAEPEAAARIFEGTFGASPDLAAVGLPTLLIHGAADGIVPVGIAEWVHGQIAGSRLEVLDGIGHVPTMTAPEQVASLIDGMFGRH
jgi:sigma-B regulation protein RsbQ